MIFHYKKNIFLSLQIHDLFSYSTNIINEEKQLTLPVNHVYRVCRILFYYMQHQCEIE